MPDRNTMEDYMAEIDATRPIPPNIGDDLVARLNDAGSYCGALSDVNHMFGEAAAEITRLRAVLAKREEAVRDAVVAAYQQVALAMHSKAVGEDEVERVEIDEWCAKRLTNLTERSNQHIKAGRKLDDPDYRLLLGEHRAYMAVRSFIHGSRAAISAMGDRRDD